MTRYKDLFIDFDDTIYDTHGNAQLSLEETYAHFGLARYFARPEEFYKPYWETNEALWAQYARGEVSRDHLIVERFRQPLSLGKGLHPTVEYCLQMSNFFLDRNACKPGVLPQAHEVLTYLRLQGYRMHVCSNGFHEVQYRKLEASDTMRFFDTVILSEDAGANKPLPAFFDYAFRQTGACPSATLMIGDNPDTDIAGALRYGLDAIYLERKRLKTAFPRPVNHIVHSLGELKDLL